MRVYRRAHRKVYAAIYNLKPDVCRIKSEELCTIHLSSTSHILFCCCFHLYVPVNTFNQPSKGSHQPEALLRQLPQTKLLCPAVKTAFRFRLLILSAALTRLNPGLTRSQLNTSDSSRNRKIENQLVLCLTEDLTHSTCLI